MTPTPIRPRNDPAQYDDLAHTWWDHRGGFAMLHWIAEARAGLIPRARRADAVLLDVACGGGLMAPYVGPLGYRHVGVDLSASAVRVARQHALDVVRADVRRLPFGDAAFDVVVAGEVLEHVPGLPGLVAELCRVLAPGGTLVVDSIADTVLGRFLSVTLAERIPGGPPKRLHEPSLFVDRAELVAECRRQGVELRLTGLRPSLLGYAAWVTRRRERAHMVPTRSTAALFQGVGVKEQVG